MRCRAARALGERTDAIVRTGDGTIVESLTEVMVRQRQPEFESHLLVDRFSYSRCFGVGSCTMPDVLWFLCVNVGVGA